MAVRDHTRARQGADALVAPGHVKHRACGDGDSGAVRNHQIVNPSGVGAEDEDAVVDVGGPAPLVVTVGQHEDAGAILGKINPVGDLTADVTSGPGAVHRYGARAAAHVHAAGKREVIARPPQRAIPAEGEIPGQGDGIANDRGEAQAVVRARAVHSVRQIERLVGASVDAGDERPGANAAAHHSLPHRQPEP